MPSPRAYSSNIATPDSGSAHTAALPLDHDTVVPRTIPQGILGLRGVIGRFDSGPTCDSRGRAMLGVGGQHGTYLEVFLLSKMCRGGEE